jgi:hypothetical protein
MTNTGHLGYGPKTTGEGDVLVVFKGATYPFILRAVRDEYWRGLCAGFYEWGSFHCRATIRIA